MAQPETDEEAGARWAILRDAGPLGQDDQIAFERWLAGDPRRDGALLRAEATLAYLDRGRALAPGEAETMAPEPPRWWIGRRRFIAGTGAGLAAAAAGLFAFLPRARTIDTDIGEIRQVPLGDGSLATLNTASRAEVTFVAQQRTVRLDTGEAWFRVAHDTSRPFVVEAGAIRVRAVGTAFSVRRRDSGCDVLVTEGVIETWVVGRESAKRRIAAGSRGFVSEAQPRVEVAAAPQEIERALAWRSGELALDGETLAYAVGEINRYNVRKIEIAAPALGDTQLAGYFRTSEPENFARTVASMTGGRVVVENDVIRLEGKLP